ncbi:MAG: FKBP-type peptidyl-prolyl cis-trans isomerase [Sulfuricella sp.]|nr:FKBP-type peptidyl-prolyl cis-trans isomerase [Sulfuricella sp.]
MTVQPGDTLTLHFRLAALSGQDLDSTFGGEPVTLRLGGGELEANLEKCLIGLETGIRYEFTLEPQEAFGFADPALTRVLPRQAFPADLPPTGSLVEFTQPDGSALAGLVTDISGDQVTVDFNHPLSDCAVRFEVEVLAVI